MKPGGMAFFLEKGSNGRDLLCIASRSRKPAVPEGAFLVVDPAQTLYPALKSDPSFGAPVTFLLASARPPHVVGSSAEAEGAAAGSAALRDSWLARLATAPQPAALERWGGAHYAVRQAVAGTPWTCVALVSRSQALEGVRGRFSAHAAAAGAITLLIFGFLAGVGREAELRHLRAISAQEERHRRSLATLLANLPGMAYRCANNRDWQMEFVSGGALGLTGYAPEELSGEGALPYAQLILPEDRERVWREVQEAIEKRESFTLSYRIRAKTGEERTVWERGCGVFNPDGSLAALEGFITDVSDRVRAQEALRAARGALEQARQLEAVGLVASGVAHEVRNPLFAISAIVAALGQKLQDRPEFGEYVGHIQDQVGRLSTLMNDLLALGRPVDREGFHETDLRAIVRGSLRHLGQATAGAEVRCRLNLPEGEVAITGSPDKLEQVVLNLVQNALFFSPEDQPVDLCLFREGDEAVLEVRDRGPGIPAELMEHLFEPFRSRRKGGTGMGLAIVRKIVTAHGGTVKAQNLSAPAGAAFTVRLPLAGARTNPPASG
jgi:PAS domain S-box-containing protein